MIKNFVFCNLILANFTAITGCGSGANSQVIAPASAADTAKTDAANAANDERRAKELQGCDGREVCFS